MEDHYGAQASAAAAAADAAVRAHFPSAHAPQYPPGYGRARPPRPAAQQQYR